MATYDYCIEIKAVESGKFPEITELKSHYPKRSLNSIVKDVNLWRRWYKGTKGEFPNYRQLNAFQKIKDEVDNILRDSKLTARDLFNKNKAVRDSFSPTILEFRINMIAEDFSRFLHDKASKSTEEVDIDTQLKALGGVSGIFDRLKKEYSEQTADVIYQKKMSQYKAFLINQGHSEAEVESLITDAIKEKARKQAENYAKKYAKVVDNFEWLSEQALNVISETEGINQNYIRREIEDEEEQEREESGESERYVDYRLGSQAEHLSAETRRIIRSIPMPDGKGGYQKDDLGRTRHLDPMLVHTKMQELFADKNPDNFDEIIAKAAELTPWVNSIKELCDTDDVAKTAFIENYFRVTNRYEKVWIDNKKGKDRTNLVNAKRTTNSVLQGLKSTIVSGVPVGNNDTTIYTPNGEIVEEAQTDDSKLSPKFQKILDLSKKLDKIHESASKLGGNPVKGNKRADDKIDERKKWLEDNPEAVATITKGLQSIGFNVTEKSVRKLFTKKFTGIEVKWRVGSFSQSIESIVAQNVSQILEQVVRNDHGMDASDFVEKRSDLYNKIASALGIVSESEVEPSTLVNDKQYATYTTPNLLHNICNMLANTDELSAEDFDRMLYNEFLRFEGMCLHNADGSIQKTGWFKRITSTSGSERDWFQAIDVMSFNNHEYEDWTAKDHFRVKLAMFFNRQGNKAAYEFPILADYFTSNFITGYAYKEDQTRLLVPVEDPDHHTYTVLADVDKVPILDDYADEMLVEIERIRNIKARIANAQENGRGRDPHLEMYERNGINFDLFPTLDPDLVISRYDELLSTEGTVAAKRYLKELAANELNDIIQDTLWEMKQAKLFTNTEYSSWYDVANDMWASEEGLNKMQQFILNDTFAKHQIIKMFYGSSAFFKDTEDYQKRSMMFHGPRGVLDNHARWNGREVDARTTETAAYIQDETLASNYLKEQNELYDQLVKEELITESQKKEFMDEWNDITPTDGQALRTLPSARVMAIKQKQWSQKLEDIYNKLTKPQTYGTITKDEFQYFMAQIQKSLATGYEVVEQTMPDGSKVYVKHPVIHKHSEAVLIAPYLPDSIEGKSPRLMALAKFCEKNNIDVIEFESAVKVGNFGVLSDPDVNKDMTPKEIEAKLNQYLEATPGALHRIDLRWYGKASSTPPHMLDETRSFASQAVKHAFNDGDGRDVLRTVDGTIIKDAKGHRVNTMTAMDLWSDIYSANIAESWQELVELFGDSSKVEKALQEELASKSYNTKDMRDAVTRLADGEFTLPFVSPSVSRAIQQLMTSLIRKRLTRPKFKGGSIIQKTSYGLDEISGARLQNNKFLKNKDKLHIKFERTRHGLRIKYVECYVPLHDSRLMAYADKNGGISPERLRELVANGTIPESVLSFIGYRTPSDAIHSIIPLRIVGFLPAASGTQIVVPKEIMKLTGHDFDVDKLLVHFRDFDFEEWDDDEIRKSWRKYVSDELNEGDEKIMRQILGQAPMSMSFNEFKRAIVRNPEQFKSYKLKTPIVRDIKYQWGILPEDQVSGETREARERRKKIYNNGLIDLLFAQLTTPDGSRRMMIPGGLNDAKRVGSAVQLIELSHSNSELADELKEFGTGEALYDALLDNNKVALKRLLNLVKQYKTKENLNSPAFAIRSRRHLTAGKKMISRYALYGSALAQLQNSGLGIAPIYIMVTDKETKEKVPTLVDIKIFGNSVVGKLDGRRNRKKGLISRVFAQLINASADNGKFPILDILNQNDATVDLTALLAANGIPLEDIVLFISGYGMKMVADKMAGNRNASTVSAIRSVIQDLITLGKNIESSLGADENVLFRIPSNLQAIEALQTNLNKDYFVNNIGVDLGSMLRDAASKTGEARTNAYLNVIDSIENQIKILRVASILQARADDFKALVMAIRPESSAGGAGPVIADMIKNDMRINKIKDDIASGKMSLSGVAPIISTFTPNAPVNTTVKGTMKQIRKNKLKIVSALNSLQYSGGFGLLSAYFPQALESWREVAVDLCGLYGSDKIPTGRVTEVLYNEITWKLYHDTKFMQDIKPQNYNGSTRQYYLSEVPRRLRTVLSKVKEIQTKLADPETASTVSPADKKFAENKLWRYMEIKSFGKEGTVVPVISLQLPGFRSKKTVENINNGWASLLTNAQPDCLGDEIDIVKLATDLYTYNLFTDGFGFGKYTFSQLAPIEVQYAVPGYIEALTRLSDAEGLFIDPAENEAFRTQYIMNHWYDSRLVKRVKRSDWRTLRKQRQEDGSIFIEPNNKLSEWFTITNEDGSGTLYRAKFDAERNMIIAVPYPKLGARTKNKHILLQYEPYMAPNTITPYYPGIDLSPDSEYYEEDPYGPDPDLDNQPSNEEYENSLEFLGQDNDPLLQLERITRGNSKTYVWEVAPGVAPDAAVRTAVETNSRIPDIQDEEPTKAQAGDYKYARTAKNSYEVSTKASKNNMDISQGDARFSALNATLENGSMITVGGERIEVGGATIEQAYQVKIKHSGKGKAPASFSPINKNYILAEMGFNIKAKTAPAPADRVKAIQIFPGISDELAEKLDTISLDSSGKMTAKDWKELSYQAAYKPLWELWASQNLDLMEELAERARGKVLTDAFSDDDAIVSQARALSDILNERFSEAEEEQERTEAETAAVSAEANAPAYAPAPDFEMQYEDPSLALLDGMENGQFGFSNDMFSLKEVEPDTPKNKHEMVQRAVKNNRERTDGKFDIVQESQDDNGNPTVETRTYYSSASVVHSARDMEVYERLYDKLIEILSKHGISVGILSDLEVASGKLGVTMFSRAQYITNGICELIKIAQGQRGKAELPEEFAHAALAMLGYDHPLVQRLFGILEDEEQLKDVFGSQYEQYLEKYNNDMYKMRKEAAGKLVAQKLFQYEQFEGKPYKNLLERIVAKIKEFIRRLSLSDFEYAKAQANDAAESLASGLLDGSLDKWLSMANLRESENLYSLEKTSKDIELQTKLVRKIIENERKRYHLYEGRLKSSGKSVSSNPTLLRIKQQIRQLEQSITDNKMDEAILGYLNESLVMLQQADKNMRDTIASHSDNQGLVTKKLNDMRDTAYSFLGMADLVNTISSEGDAKLSDATLEATDRIVAYVNRLLKEHLRLSRLYAAKMLQDYVGEGIVEMVDPESGKELTPQVLVRQAQHDLSWWSRWLDSMSDAGDITIRAFGRAIRDMNDRVMRKDMDAQARIEAALARLKAAGITDQSFMFENTGDMKKYITEAKAKSLGEAKYNFWKTMIDLKQDLELLVPNHYRNTLRTVKLEKSATERIAAAKGTSAKLEKALQIIREGVMGEKDEGNTAIDFEGNQFDTLSLKYMRMREGKTAADMSTDVASAMLAYAHTIHRYNEAMKIVNILENAKYALSQRDVTQTRNGVPQKEHISGKGYDQTTPLTKKQKETMLGAMLSDMMSMQFYGNLHKQEGNIKLFGLDTKLNKEKVANKINYVTALSQLALNLPQRISNVATGAVQILEEAAAREFFSGRDIAWANKVYAQEVPDYILHSADVHNTSKLAMFGQYFDVRQDWDKDVNDKGYHRSRASRIFKPDLLYATMTAGEHYLSYSTALAVAHRYRMRPAGWKEGDKTVSLYDAFEVTYIDPALKAGAQFTIKKGYTKEDGSEFTKKDAADLTALIAGINFRLQGIYNIQDRNALQQHWYGSLLIMYRKWIQPSLRRRYGSNKYNALTKSKEEGFYVSFGKYLWNCLKDFRHFRQAVTLNYDKLEDFEKANVWRAVTELGTLLGTAISIMLLEGIKGRDDDDDDSTWAEDMLLMQLYRLRAEIGAMSPTPWIVQEGLKILSSPFAGMKTIESTLALINLLNPMNYKVFGGDDAVIKSGQYKDKSKAYKYLMEAPLLRINKTVSRAFDPGSLIEFYKY